MSSTGREGGMGGGGGMMPATMEERAAKKRVQSVKGACTRSRRVAAACAVVLQLELRPTCTRRAFAVPSLTLLCRPTRGRAQEYKLTE